MSDIWCIPWLIGGRLSPIPSNIVPGHQLVSLIFPNFVKVIYSLWFFSRVIRTFRRSQKVEKYHWNSEFWTNYGKNSISGQDLTSFIQTSFLYIFWKPSFFWFWITQIWSCSLRFHRCRALTNSQIGNSQNFESWFGIKIPFRQLLWKQQ